MYFVNCVNTIILTYIGNTTNLWQHLEESHIQEFFQAKKEAKEVANESESSNGS